MWMSSASMVHGRMELAVRRRSGNVRRCRARNQTGTFVHCDTDWSRAVATIPVMDDAFMDDAFTARGFLPPLDPLRAFPPGSPYRMLDDVGAELPQRLLDPGFRAWAEQLKLPEWRAVLTPETLP